MIVGPLTDGRSLSVSARAAHTSRGKWGVILDEGRLVRKIGANLDDDLGKATVLFVRQTFHVETTRFPSRLKRDRQGGVSPCAKNFMWYPCSGNENEGTITLR